MGPGSHSKDPRPAGVLDRGILVVIKRILSLVSEGSGLDRRIRSQMECYLLSEPKVRGYKKRMLSLWLIRGMFWVLE